jgi:hypothetical protein
VNFTFKKRDASQAAPEAERRRIGLIVHDDRGNASVDWRDAPLGTERTVLEILGEPTLAVKNEDTSFDPYARSRAPRAAAKPARTSSRTDLRALSEHIKLMRALEERKRNGEDTED